MVKQFWLLSEIVVDKEVDQDYHSTTWLNQMYN